MKDQLVAIAQSPNPNDLLVLKSKLDGHRIWCYLADQHTATMIGYASVATGDVKLTQKKIDDRNARLAAFGIIFFFTALAFLILYAFVEKFIMDLFW